ncbi:MAG: serine/threonine-protein kinase [Myxococcota bacterium]
MDVTTAAGVVLNGAYRLDSLLGKGGMGAVYRAVQLSVNRPVAIKLLSFPDGDEVAQQKLLRRFEREALATSRLSHPNTVRLYDFGQSDGMPYLVLELLEGQTLRQRMHQLGALPSREVHALLQQVASALTEAHGYGIIHRDLKPDNIFLTRIPGLPDVVKVMDFGIASWREDEANLTGQQMVGTVRYMAPEQLKAAQPTPATDLYALGIMAFEMLAGVAPFNGRTEAIMAQHLTEPRPRLPPSLEPGWGDLLDAMTAKEPEDRFQTTGELLSALEQIRDEVIGLGLPPNLAAYQERVGGTATTYNTAPRSTGAGPAARFATGQRRGAGAPQSTKTATGASPARAPRSAWPWLVLALLVAGGGIAAAVLASGGGAAPVALASADAAPSPPPTATAAPATAAPATAAAATSMAATDPPDTASAPETATAPDSAVAAEPEVAPADVAVAAAPDGAPDAAPVDPAAIALHLDSTPSGARRRQGRRRRARAVPADAVRPVAVGRPDADARRDAGRLRADQRGAARLRRRAAHRGPRSQEEEARRRDGVGLRAPAPLRCRCRSRDRPSSSRWPWPRWPSPRRLAARAPSSSSRPSRSRSSRRRRRRRRPTMRPPSWPSGSGTPRRSSRPRRA